MRQELAEMTERVSALHGRAASSTPAEPLLDEVEDALAAGYAQALAGDAWSMATEQRLHELISDPDVPVRGRELRKLAGEHAACQRDLIDLRRELAALRDERDRLRSVVLPASAASRRR